MSKGGKIFGIIISIVLVIAIAAVGILLYMRHLIIGTYYIKSFTANIKGYEVSATYDDKWHVDLGNNTLNEILKLDKYLENQKNDIAYITIHDDGTYYYHLGVINGETQSNGDYEGKYAFAFGTASVTFEGQDFDITLKKNTIVIENEYLEVVFEK